MARFVESRESFDEMFPAGQGLDPSRFEYLALVDRQIAKEDFQPSKDYLGFDLFSEKTNNSNLQVGSLAEGLNILRSASRHTGKVPLLALETHGSYGTGTTFYDNKGTAHIYSVGALQEEARKAGFASNELVIIMGSCNSAAWAAHTKTMEGFTKLNTSRVAHPGQNHPYKLHFSPWSNSNNPIRNLFVRTGTTFGSLPISGIFDNLTRFEDAVRFSGSTRRPVVDSNPAFHYESFRAWANVFKHNNLGLNKKVITPLSAAIQESNALAALANNTNYILGQAILDFESRVKNNDPETLGSLGAIGGAIVGGLASHLLVSAGRKGINSVLERLSNLRSFDLGEPDIQVRSPNPIRRSVAHGHQVQVVPKSGNPFVPPAPKPPLIPGVNTKITGINSGPNFRFSQSSIAPDESVSPTPRMRKPRPRFIRNPGFNPLPGFPGQAPVGPPIPGIRYTRNPGFSFLPMPPKPPDLPYEVPKAVFRHVPEVPQTLDTGKVNHEFGKAMPVLSKAEEIAAGVKVVSKAEQIDAGLRDIVPTPEEVDDAHSGRSNYRRTTRGVLPTTKYTRTFGSKSTPAEVTATSLAGDIRVPRVSRMAWLAAGASLVAGAVAYFGFKNSSEGPVQPRFNSGTSLGLPSGSGVQLSSLKPNIPVDNRALASGLALTVKSITDADTINVSQLGTVRILGIDAPETDHGSWLTRAWDWLTGENQTAWGAKSTNRLRQLAPVGSTVTIMPFGRDTYGRTLATVASNGLDVSTVLAQEGYVIPFPGSNVPPALAANIQKAALEAQSKGRGVYNLQDGLDTYPEYYKNHRGPKQFPRGPISNKIYQDNFNLGSFSLAPTYSNNPIPAYKLSFAVSARTQRLAEDLGVIKQFEDSTGLASYMYMALHSRFSNKPFSIGNLTPEENRDLLDSVKFDQLVKSRTWGNQWLIRQEGTRGLLDSGLVKMSRYLDRLMGTVGLQETDPNTGEVTQRGLAHWMTLGSYDNVSNLILNTANYAWLTIPTLKIGSAISSQVAYHNQRWASGSGIQAKIGKFTWGLQYVLRRSAAQQAYNIIDSTGLVFRTIDSLTGSNQGTKLQTKLLEIFTDDTIKANDPGMFNKSVALSPKTAMPKSFNARLLETYEAIQGFTARIPILRALSEHGWIGGFFKVFGWEHFKEINKARITVARGTYKDKFSVHGSRLRAFGETALNVLDDAASSAWMGSKRLGMFITGSDDFIRAAQYDQKAKALRDQSNPVAARRYERLANVKTAGLQAYIHPQGARGFSGGLGRKIGLVAIPLIISNTLMGQLGNLSRASIWEQQAQMQRYERLANSYGGFNSEANIARPELAQTIGISPWITNPFSTGFGSNLFTKSLDMLMAPLALPIAATSYIGQLAYSWVTSRTIGSSYASQRAQQHIAEQGVLADAALRLTALNQSSPAISDLLYIQANLGLGPNQVDQSGKMQTSLALQGSVADTLFTPTMAMSFVRDKALISLSLQGPVQLPIGFTLTAPLAFQKSKRIQGQSEANRKQINKWFSFAKTGNTVVDTLGSFAFDSASFIAQGMSSVTAVGLRAMGFATGGLIHTPALLDAAEQIETLRDDYEFGSWVYGSTGDNLLRAAYYYGGLKGLKMITKAGVKFAATKTLDKYGHKIVSKIGDPLIIDAIGANNKPGSHMVSFLGDSVRSTYAYQATNLLKKAAITVAKFGLLPLVVMTKVPYLFIKSTIRIPLDMIALKQNKVKYIGSDELLSAWDRLKASVVKAFYTGKSNWGEQATKSIREAKKDIYIDDDQVKNIFRVRGKLEPLNKLSDVMTKAKVHIKPKLAKAGLASLGLAVGAELALSVADPTFRTSVYNRLYNLDFAGGYYISGLAKILTRRNEPISPSATPITSPSEMPGFGSGSKSVARADQSYGVFANILDSFVGVFSGMYWQTVQNYLGNSSGGLTTVRVGEDEVLIGGAYWQTRMLGSPFVGTIAKKLTSIKDTPTERLTQEIPIRLLTNNWIGSRISQRDSGDPFRPKAGVIRKLWHHSAPNQTRAVNLAMRQRQALTNWVLSTDPSDATTYFFTRATHEGKASRIILDFSSVGRISERGPLGLNVKNMSLGQAIKALGLDRYMSKLMASEGQVDAGEAVDSDLFSGYQEKRLGMTPGEMQEYLSQSFYGTMIGISMISLALFVPYKIARDYMVKAVSQTKANDPNAAFGVISKLHEFTIKSVQQTVPHVSYVAVAPGPEGPFKVASSSNNNQFIRYLIGVADPNSGVTTVYGFGNQAFEYAQPLKGLFNLRSNIDHKLFVTAFQHASRLSGVVGGPGVKTVHNSIDIHLAGSALDTDIQGFNTTRSIHDMLNSRKSIGSNLSNFVIDARAEKIRLEIEIQKLNSDLAKLKASSPTSHHITRKEAQLAELTKHIRFVDQAIQASNIRLNALNDIDKMVHVVDVDGNTVKVTLGELLEQASGFKGAVHKGFVSSIRKRFGGSGASGIVTNALNQEVSIGNTKVAMHSILKAVAEDSYDLVSGFGMDSITKFGYNPANPDAIRTDLLGPGLRKLFSDSVKANGLAAFSMTGIRSVFNTWWSSARAQVWLMGMYEDIANGISGRSTRGDMGVVDKLRGNVLDEIDNLLVKYTGQSGSVIKDYAAFRAEYEANNAESLRGLKYNEREEQILKAFEEQQRAKLAASVTSDNLADVEKDFTTRTQEAIKSLSNENVARERQLALRDKFVSGLGSKSSKIFMSTLGLVGTVAGVASLLAPTMDVKVLRMQSSSQLEKELAASAFMPDVVKATATVGLTGVSILALSAGAGAIAAGRHAGLSYSSIFKAAPKSLYTSGVQTLTKVKNVAKAGRAIEGATSVLMLGGRIIAAGITGIAGLAVSAPLVAVAAGIGSIAVAVGVSMALNTDTAKRFFDKFSFPNLSKAISEGPIGAILDPIGTLELALSNYAESAISKPPERGESGISVGIRSTYNTFLSMLNPTLGLTRPELFASRSNFGSASLINPYLARSPIWYGNMYDLLQKKAKDQEALTKASAHQFLYQWLAPSLQGQDSDNPAYSDFGDVPTVMSVYKPRSLTSSPAVQQQLIRRALASQDVMSYLHSRHKNWAIQNNQETVTEKDFQGQTSYSGYGPKNLPGSSGVPYTLDEFLPQGSLFGNPVGRAVRLAPGPAISSSYTQALPNNINNVTRWSGLANEAAKQYGVDPIVILTIIQKESGGNPNARSWVGAQGLMQVMPFHFTRGENGYDPRTNIFRGAAYLAKAKQAGARNMFEVAVYYNAGPGGLAEWQRTGTFRYSTDRNSRYQQTLPYARTMASMYNNMARQMTVHRLEQSQAPRVQAEHIPVTSGGQETGNLNVLPSVGISDIKRTGAIIQASEGTLTHKCFIFADTLVRSKGLLGVKPGVKTAELSGVGGTSIANLQNLINNGNLLPGSVVWMNRNPGTFRSAAERNQFNQSFGSQFSHHWIVYLGNNQWADNVSVKSPGGTFTTEQMIQVYNNNGRTVYKVFLPVSRSGKPVRLQPIIVPKSDNYMAPTVNPTGVTISPTGIVTPAYRNGEQYLQLIDNRTGSWDVTNPRPDNHFWGRY